MSSLPVVDPEAIENLRALSPDDGDVFLKEILAIFIEDTPIRISDLHKSLDKNDLETFIRAAHSIKGSSSNVGAMQLRAISESLEHHARKNGLVNAQPHIAQIEAAYLQVHQELKSLLGS